MAKELLQVEASKGADEAQHLLFLKICLVQHHLHPLPRLLGPPLIILLNSAVDTDLVDVYQNIAVIPPFR